MDDLNLLDNPWFDESCIEGLRLKTEARREYKNDKIDETYMKYLEAKENFKEICKAAKRLYGVENSSLKRDDGMHEQPSNERSFERKRKYSGDGRNRLSRDEPSGDRHSRDEHSRDRHSIDRHGHDRHSSDRYSREGHNRDRDNRDRYSRDEHSRNRHNKHGHSRDRHAEDMSRHSSYLEERKDSYRANYGNKEGFELDDEDDLLPEGYIPTEVLKNVESEKKRKRGVYYDENEPEISYSMYPHQRPPRPTHPNHRPFMPRFPRRGRGRPQFFPRQPRWNMPYPAYPMYPPYFNPGIQPGPFEPIPPGNAKFKDSSNKKKMTSSGDGRSHNKEQDGNESSKSGNSSPEADRSDDECNKKLQPKGGGSNFPFPPPYFGPTLPPPYWYGHPGMVPPYMPHYGRFITPQVRPTFLYQSIQNQDPKSYKKKDYNTPSKYFTRDIAQGAFKKDSKFYDLQSEALKADAENNEKVESERILSVDEIKKEKIDDDIEIERKNEKAINNDDDLQSSKSSGHIQTSTSKSDQVDHTRATPCILNQFGDNVHTNINVNSLMSGNGGYQPLATSVKIKEEPKEGVLLPLKNKVIKHEEGIEPHDSCSSKIIDDKDDLSEEELRKHKEIAALERFCKLSGSSKIDKYSRNAKQVAKVNAEDKLHNKLRKKPLNEFFSGNIGNESSLESSIANTMMSLPTSSNEVFEPLSHMVAKVPVFPGRLLSQPKKPISEAKRKEFLENWKDDNLQTPKSISRRKEKENQFLLQQHIKIAISSNSGNVVNTKVEICILCQAYLFTDEETRNHLKSDNHYKKYKECYPIPNKNNELFKKEFRSISVLWYCKLCVENIFTDDLYDHMRNALHIENMKMASPDETDDAINDTTSVIRHFAKPPPPPTSLGLGLHIEERNNEPLPDEMYEIARQKHPVNAVIQICDKMRWSSPIFTVCKEFNYNGRNSFLVKVTVNGKHYPCETPQTSKKMAKYEAACTFLTIHGLSKCDDGLKS